VSVIAVLICYCKPNFNKIGSRVRPPDAHNCWMYNAPLLGNGRCHGNRIMADMWGHDEMWPPKLRPSRFIRRWVMAFRIYFQHGGRPPFRILKILIFNHVTFVLVLTCCCVPNFIKIGSRFRHPDAHNCTMFNAPLLGNGRCAVARQRPLPWQPNRGGHVRDMMGCDHPSWVSVGPLAG